MFQSRPSGRGPVDKINSVSSNIPSNSSINGETVSPECVPLCLTYIRWSTPNLCASLGLKCWFKISTDSANSPSCITHCGSLAQTQCTVTSQLSLRFPLFSISFITACLFHVCHRCLRASCFSAGLPNCLCQFLHLPPLSQSHQSVSKQLKSYASSMCIVPLTEILRFSMW